MSTDPSLDSHGNFGLPSVSTLERIRNSDTRPDSELTPSELNYRTWVDQSIDELKKIESLSERKPVEPHSSKEDLKNQEVLKSIQSIRVDEALPLDAMEKAQLGAIRSIVRSYRSTIEECPKLASEIRDRTYRIRSKVEKLRKKSTFMNYAVTVASASVYFSPYLALVSIFCGLWNIALAEAMREAVASLEYLPIAKLQEYHEKLNEYIEWNNELEILVQLEQEYLRGKLEEPKKLLACSYQAQANTRAVAAIKQSLNCNFSDIKTDLTFATPPPKAKGA